jgi:nicotinamide mononucleotide transporter
MIMNWFTWTPLELWANVFTIACIVLAGRNSIHTWWTGLVGCVLFGIMFYNVQLYADVTLQIFFFVTGILGWIGWNANKIIYKVDKPTPIINVNGKTFSIMLGIAVAVALTYGWLLHTFTNAYAPWIDSTVLAFSVVAQLLLMGRSIQTWKVWLIVNTLSVPLFWSRELYLTSVLYGFFWINAAVSYFNWKKLMEKQ